VPTHYLAPHSFHLDLIYKGRCPAIKEQIVAMALNGSGIRDYVCGCRKDFDGCFYDVRAEFQGTFLCHLESG
jgi:hypothetical protein